MRGGASPGRCGSASPNRSGGSYHGPAGCHRPSRARRIVVGVEESRGPLAVELQLAPATGAGDARVRVLDPLRDGEDSSPTPHKTTAPARRGTTSESVTPTHVPHRGVGRASWQGRRRRISWPSRWPAGALQRDLALRPDRPCTPCRASLVRGIRAEYRSRDVGEKERVIGVDLGGRRSSRASWRATGRSAARSRSRPRTEDQQAEALGAHRRRRHRPCSSHTAPAAIGYGVPPSISTGGPGVALRRGEPAAAPGALPRPRARSDSGSRQASRTTATPPPSPSGGSGQGGASQHAHAHARHRRRRRGRDRRSPLPRLGRARSRRRDRRWPAVPGKPPRAWASRGPCLGSRGGPRRRPRCSAGCRRPGAREPRSIGATHRQSKRWPISAACSAPQSGRSRTSSIRTSSSWVVASVPRRAISCSSPCEGRGSRGGDSARGRDALQIVEAELGEEGRPDRRRARRLRGARRSAEGRAARGLRDTDREPRRRHPARPR